MSNPTSYTDEQVLSAIEALGSYETMCGFAHILAGVFADRRRLRERLRVRVMELYAERNKFDLLIKRLVAIHALLYPPQMSLEDGRVMAFRPPNLDPHELLQRLSDEIRAIPDAIDTACATPNETKETGHDDDA